MIAMYQGITKNMDSGDIHREKIKTCSNISLVCAKDSKHPTQINLLSNE